MLVHITFELITMVFEFLILIGIEFHSFAPDTETAFCPTAVLRYSMCTSEPLHLVSEVKVNLFKFESAEAYRFLKNDAINRKIPLKLIHFKSRNSGVTWTRFKYFKLLANFAARLIHFVLYISVFHCILPILNYNSLDGRR